MKNIFFNIFLNKNILKINFIPTNQPIVYKRKLQLGNAE